MGRRGVDDRKYVCRNEAGRIAPKTQCGLDIVGFAVGDQDGRTGSCSCAESDGGTAVAEGASGGCACKDELGSSEKQPRLMSGLGGREEDLLGFIWSVCSLRFGMQSACNRTAVYYGDFKS